MVAGQRLKATFVISATWQNSKLMEMKMIVSISLKSAALAALLTAVATHAHAETGFSTLTGIAAEPMNAAEMEATHGKNLGLWLRSQVGPDLWAITSPAAFPFSHGCGVNVACNTNQLLPPVSAFYRSVYPNGVYVVTLPDTGFAFPNPNLPITPNTALQLFPLVRFN